MAVVVNLLHHDTPDVRAYVRRSGKSWPNAR